MAIRKAPASKPIIDLNHDDVITEEEISQADNILNIDLKEEKANTQKKMAWFSMWVMVIFTAALYSPMMTDSRVEALNNMLGLFYIANAGIVGAYMGVSAWMSK